MKHLSYLDFKLSIEPQGERYRAAVTRASGEEVSQDFEIPFSRDKLNFLVMKMGHRRGIRKASYSDEMDILRDLGGQLFQSLFSGEMLECFRERQARARGEEKGIRVRLSFKDAPKLMDVLWEFLFDPEWENFLAHSNRTPIVRYMKMPQVQPLAARFPLRVLVVISSPKDYPWIDIKREISLLRKALGPLQRAGSLCPQVSSEPSQAGKSKQAGEENRSIRTARNEARVALECQNEPLGELLA